MAGEVTPDQSLWNKKRVAHGEATSAQAKKTLVTTNRGNGIGEMGVEGAQLEIYDIAGVGNAETWISNIPNIIAVAWQSDVAGTDECGCTLIDQATGEVEFGVDGGTNNGWIWVLRGK